MPKKGHVLFSLIFVSILYIFSVTKIDRASVLSSISDRSVFGRLLPSFSKITRQQAFQGVLERTSKKKGTYAIIVKNLNTDEMYNFNETELFYAASLYKTPIAASVFRLSQENIISLDSNLKYMGIDTTGGTGTLYTFPVGTEFTVDFILDRLIKDSDNIAQNILIRSFTQSEIKEGFNIIESKNKFYDNNTSTVAYQVEFYEQLVESDFLTPTNKEVLLNKLASTSFDDRIHTGLTPDVKFSHKIGNWGDTGSWHDCGVASKGYRKVVICVMSRHTTFQEFLIVTKDVGNFANMLF
ncbi:serine hydrolase [Patescibacteria group bacterium]